MAASASLGSIRREAICAPCVGLLLSSNRRHGNIALQWGYIEGEVGRLAGHSDVNDLEDAGHARSFARLRHRTTHRGNQRTCAGSELRHDLSRVAEARAG